MSTLTRRAPRFAIGGFFASAVAKIFLSTAAIAAPPPAPASQPAATEPTTRTSAEMEVAAQVERLWDGRIKLTVPSGCDVVKRGDDNLQLFMKRADDLGSITVVVTPQNGPVPLSNKPRMAVIVGDATREQAKKLGEKIELAPRVEKDDRYFLVIHDRIWTPDGKQLQDRKQMWRVMNLSLVFCVATALTDDPAKAQILHSSAEAMLDKATVGNADKPPKAGAAPGAGTPGAKNAKVPPLKMAALPKAHLFFPPPAGWTPELNDAASGIVATLRQTNDQTNLLAVQVSPLPKGAKDDPALRDLAADEMSDGQREQFKISGGTIVGATEKVADDRFLKKTRTRYESQGVKFRITTRTRLVGSNLVSLATVTLEDQGDAVEAVADQLAVDLSATAAGGTAPSPGTSK